MRGQRYEDGYLDYSDNVFRYSVTKEIRATLTIREYFGGKGADSMNVEIRRVSPTNSFSEQFNLGSIDEVNRMIGVLKLVVHQHYVG